MGLSSFMSNGLFLMFSNLHFNFNQFTTTFFQMNFQGDSHKENSP